MSTEDEVALLALTGDDRRMTTIHSSTATDGYAMAGGDGERLWIVGDTMTLKATGESTGGRLVVLENLTAPGGGPPPHVHTREDEFFYVLDGTFEIRIGDDVHGVGPGGFAYVPRGTVHNFRNTADTPSRILVGFTPGGMEGFFRDSGRPALDDGPAPPIDDDEVSRTMAAAQQHGLRAVLFEDSRPSFQTGHPRRAPSARGSRVPALPTTSFFGPRAVSKTSSWTGRRSGACCCRRRPPRLG